MSSLTSSLLDPLNTPTKDNIINAFWGPIPLRQLHTFNNAPSLAYWKFYVKECEHALHDGGRHTLARTHQDIVDIVSLLRDNHERSGIRDVLRGKFTKPHENEDELINNSIDLAAALVLMIDFGNIQYGFSGRRQLEWDKGSLRDCISSYFSSPPMLGHDGVKLQRVFNAMNLDRIAGVQILPTNNLLDHLRLTDDDTKLYVFYHVSFLKYQGFKGSSMRTDICSCILPSDLVEETLRTLALLFPQSDPQTKNWCHQLPAPFSLDDELLQCGHLKTDDRQIENFRYWHDRLVVLKQVFDEATPSTLSQWWHDRRNGVQWYTFWVAIVVLTLTLVFGLVQSVEGALQVYGTFHGEKGN